jgi:haloalkane dehalogenase
VKNMLKKIRTPDSRFENLHEFPFTPNYADINGLRIHYIDEGTKSAIPILLMHGEPSWSYLYRKMIPILKSAGYRVLAPDLIGFGRSDKLVRMKDYSYKLQVELFSKFVVDLNLTNLTLFCQDWGGLIGLRVVADQPERFSRVIAANTGLPGLKGFRARTYPFLFRIAVRKEGKVSLVNPNDEEFEEGSMKPLIRWVAYTKTAPEFPIGDIIQSATQTKLSSEVLAAYNAPFPDESYKAGARIMPSLVPTQLKENYKVWEEVFAHWTKPFLTIFSDRDPITRGGEKRFQMKIPGAKNQPHTIIKGAGHFLQEDKAEEIAELIIKFINS